MFHSGDAEGPTANCGEEEFCSHPKENKTVRDYIDYLKKYKQSGYSKDFPCLYLKDWHFTRCVRNYIFLIRLTNESLDILLWILWSFEHIMLQGFNQV